MPWCNMPTCCRRCLEAVGGDAAAGQFDGSSFLSVLNDSSKSHRKYAYAMHNNLPEGPPYSIRSITDGHFHYLRNGEALALYQQMGHGVERRAVLDKLALEDRRRPARRPDCGTPAYRPAEQLYDVEKDPYEMTNVAADPKLAEAKAGLSAELDRWLSEEKDPGRHARHAESA